MFPPADDGGSAGAAGSDESSSSGGGGNSSSGGGNSSGGSSEFGGRGVTYLNPAATVHLTSGAGGNLHMRTGPEPPPQVRCARGAPERWPLTDRRQRGCCLAIPMAGGQAVIPGCQ